jgi:hemoglobin
MKRTTLTYCLSVLTLFLSCAPAGYSQEKAEPKCFYTGEPAKSDLSATYEGTSYYFSSADLREKFNRERADSLYEKIGGKSALDAAVELFYVKVLADDRVNHFFEDVNMNAQKSKQKAFLAAALGAPAP